MDDLTSDQLHIYQLTLGFETSQGFGLMVDNVNITIPPGKTVALIGESGSGKSLTAQAIMQLLPPTCSPVQGSQVIWQKRNILTLSAYQMRTVRGGELAMIFQEPMTSLNPVLTVGQQLQEAIFHHQANTKNISEKVIELLTAVGLPEPALQLTRYPHQLSGGMKQRVMIAMALAGEPKLLIADEPTTALDATTQQQILTLLHSIQTKLGMAMLFITHDFAVARKMADFVMVMYAGQIVEANHVDQFFKNPKHPYSQQLFAAIPSLTKRDRYLAVIPEPLMTEQKTPQCRFAPRCVHAQAVCWQHAPQWSHDASTGDQHGVRCHLYDKTQTITKSAKQTAQLKLRKNKTEDSEPLLEISNIRVHYPLQRSLLAKGKVLKAVDGVDLIIPTAKTLALVGESGCGKTTLAKAILHLTPLTSGEIHFSKQNITNPSRRQLKKLRQHIQFIFQDPFSALDPRMLVRDVILEGVYAQQGRGNKQQLNQKLITLLDQVGLPKDSGDRYPHEFSGGQRQRIGIARALALSPKLLICDEITSALDVSVQAHILNLLLELQQELQLSYLFITHNMSVVSYLADDVAVMYSGRIVEQGDVTTIMQSAKHPYTKTLLSAVLET